MELKEVDGKFEVKNYDDNVMFTHVTGGPTRVTRDVLEYLRPLFTAHKIFITTKL